MLQLLKNQNILKIKWKLSIVLLYQMDFLKEMVAGPKKRFKKDGYNLDFTYITSRIIAMAFPASGFQKLYRNSVDTICEVLQKYHKSKYLIINLSGRDVDEKKLKYVESFEWEDHKAPPLETLFVICELIGQFLSKDDQNVVAIHCNQGKGRTGTIICCFLLYMQLFHTPADALDFYAKKRFQQEGYGVTQPCQIKYINYFAAILANPKLKPQVVCLRKIVFKGIHKIQEPYLKLRSALNSNSQNIISTKSTPEILRIQKDKQVIWKIPQKFFFAGDMYLEIKDSKKIIGKGTIANYTFNTTFVSKQKVIQVSVDQLSPDSTIKSGIFDNNFKLQLWFKSKCNCPADIDFSDRCQLCKEMLIHEEIKNEKIISSIKNRGKLLKNNKDIIGLNESQNKSIKIIHQSLHQEENQEIKKNSNNK